MVKKVKEQGQLDVITCVVQRGKADLPVKAALKAGAGGATVYFAMGTGVREKLGDYGLAIQPEKEVITIVTTIDVTDRVFDAMVEAGKLDQPGQGFAYVHRISRAIGFVTTND